MAEKGVLRAKYITASEKTMLLSLIEEKREVLFNKGHDLRVLQR